MFKLKVGNKPSVLELLAPIRKFAGPRKTLGISDDQIEEFASIDTTLKQAVEAASEAFDEYKKKYSDLIQMDEDELCAELQKDFVNFYAHDSINPYVPLAARGPWIVTVKGAVVYDTGGYGMLGFGHAPEQVLKALAHPHVMANIMTPSFMDRELSTRLKREIGRQRPGGKICPYAKFVCINSGSEAMTLALRIADIHLNHMIKERPELSSRPVKSLAVKGAFHGRTERPAQLSDSSLPKYKTHLASFRNFDRLITVPENDVAALQQIFDRVGRGEFLIDVMAMEPVMGEGNPGEPVSVAFYNAARELTKKHGALLIADSIQAGLRAHGCLSIVDYPGFEELEAPDMETFSKALNAGQFPLSVVALTKHTADMYATGVYGNTMTSNPRALEVACAVLDSITPALRENIKTSGALFLSELRALQAQHPQHITQVKGTGLLISASIDPARLKVEGRGGLEERMRRHGIGVIHGGNNALRFTPHFHLSAREIKLICQTLGSLLKESAS